MRRFATLILLLAILAAACGGDEGPEASTDLNVKMSDFAFDPDKVAVPPDAEITITLDNVGSVEHNWVILKDGVQIESEADLPDDEATLASDFVYWEAMVQPGETQTLTFTAPERRFFQVICTVPGHFTAGMEGRLQVVRPDEG